MADMTTGDLALMRDGGMFGGGNGLLWFIGILIILGMFNGGGFGMGGNGNYVTQAELTAGLNNQATQAQLQQIALSSANNNYETAQLIHAQSNEMLQQNNANLINAIQGFNNLGMQLTNQTNILAGKVEALGAQLNECCCSIKTQMLQDRLQDRDRQLLEAQNALSNAAQTQTILGNLGRFVAWTASGTNGTVAASAGTGA